MHRYGWALCRGMPSKLINSYLVYQTTPLHMKHYVDAIPQWILWRNCLHLVTKLHHWRCMYARLQQFSWNRIRWNLKISKSMACDVSIPHLIIATAHSTFTTVNMHEGRAWTGSVQVTHVSCLIRESGSCYQSSAGILLTKQGSIAGHYGPSQSGSLLMNRMLT